jgi:hypothetical protein
LPADFGVRVARVLVPTAALIAPTVLAVLMALGGLVATQHGFAIEGRASLLWYGWAVIPSYGIAVNCWVWLRTRNSATRDTGNRVWRVAVSVMFGITLGAGFDVWETARRLDGASAGWIAPVKWILLAIATLGVLFIAATVAPPAETVVEQELKFDDLCHAEMNATARARGPETARPQVDPKTTFERTGETDQDLFGIALSGGGIRSATFNLGVLQALHDFEVLDYLDYLSTVSGGGYIGGFWTAWRTRGPTADTELFPGKTDDFTERAEVRHLREFSNFLSPRLGFLNYDLGRMIVAGLSATIPALLAALSILMIALGAWRGLVWMVLVSNNLALALLAIVVVPAVSLAAFEAAWRGREGKAGRGYWSVSTVGVAVGAVIALFLTSVYEQSDPTSWDLLIPGGAWFGAALALVAVRFVTSRFVKRWTSGWRKGLDFRVLRQGIDRAVSRLLLCSAAWVVIAAVWLIGERIWRESSARLGTGGNFAGLVASGTVLGFVFQWAQKFLSQRPSNPLGENLSGALKRRLPQVLAYATIVAMMLVIVFVLSWLETTSYLRWSFLVPGVITLAMLVFFDPNEVGLHSFYRARLARAYLGASSPDNQRRAEAVSTDDLCLAELTTKRPLHLVCCTANDLAGDHLANLHRGAVSAVLSPVGYSVGNAVRQWKDTTDVPTLGSAITASGAAFNSHMGALSMQFGPAVTFLMTAFNLRLGLWLSHPRVFENPPHRLFPGLSFYLELFSASTVKGDRVLLSDGGHFENMAVYELIRRHCRYIIVSDCGADPEVAFDDLGNLVRRVREDFKVEIEIDLAPLLPDKATGHSRQPMVAGDIYYPNGDVGVLLMIKPSITGNEPVDVGQYRTRNPAFPHESTGDQFYDEAQWESYRRLGIHAVRASMGDVVDAVNAEHRRASERKGGENTRRAGWRSSVFAQARMRWQPRPSDLEARLSRIASRVTTIDTALHQTNAKNILVQVYREIHELDGEVRRRGAPAVAPDDHPENGNPKQKDAPPVPARAVLPQQADIAPSLHALRQAILFMEETYLTEQLERHYNHPLYLGLMNYFARWAFAPIFRMWWPLLKSLYCREFTSFMERRFGLESVSSTGDPAEQVITSIAPLGDGFAAHCWRLERGDSGRPHVENGEQLLSFNLRMRYAGEPDPYTIQAALAFVRRVGDVAGFHCSDFYVPAGLWGIGIGEAFLDELTRPSLFVEDGPLAEVANLVVAVSRPGTNRGVVRKESADLTTMYRVAGFRAVKPSELTTDKWRQIQSTVNTRADAVRWMIRPAPVRPNPPMDRALSIG